MYFYQTKTKIKKQNDMQKQNKEILRNLFQSNNKETLNNFFALFLCFHC